MADTAVSDQVQPGCPAYNGPAYDEVPSKATKHLQKILHEWTRTKANCHRALGNVGRDTKCLGAADDIRQRMAKIDMEFTDIVRTSNTIQAKGAGYYSDQDLRASLAKCEAIALSIKSLVDMFQVLNRLSQTNCG